MYKKKTSRGWRRHAEGKRLEYLLGDLNLLRKDQIIRKPFTPEELQCLLRALEGNDSCKFGIVKLSKYDINMPIPSSSSSSTTFFKKALNDAKFDIAYQLLRAGADPLAFSSCYSNIDMTIRNLLIYDFPQLYVKWILQFIHNKWLLKSTSIKNQLNCDCCSNNHKKNKIKEVINTSNISTLSPCGHNVCESCIWNSLSHDTAINGIACPLCKTIVTEEFDDCPQYFYQYHLQYNHDKKDKIRLDQVANSLELWQQLDDVYISDRKFANDKGSDKSNISKKIKAFNKGMSLRQYCYTKVGDNKATRLEIFLEAISRGKHLMLLAVIMAGMDVNIRDKYGMTPIMMVSLFLPSNSDNIWKVVRTLLDAGADPLAINSLGYSSVDIAYGNGHHVLANYLHNYTKSKTNDGNKSNNIYNLEIDLEISDSSCLDVKSKLVVLNGIADQKRDNSLLSSEEVVSSSASVSTKESPLLESLSVPLLLNSQAKLLEIIPINATVGFNCASNFETSTSISISASTKMNEVSKDLRHAGAGSFIVDGLFAESILQDLEIIANRLPCLQAAPSKKACSTRSYFCDALGDIRYLFQKGLSHLPCLKNKGYIYKKTMMHMRFLQYLRPGGYLPPHIDLNRTDHEGDVSTHTFILYLDTCHQGGETVLLDSLGSNTKTASASDEKGENKSHINNYNDNGNDHTNIDKTRDGCKRIEKRNAFQDLEDEFTFLNMQEVGIGTTIEECGTKMVDTQNINNNNNNNNIDNMIRNEGVNIWQAKEIFRVKPVRGRLLLFPHVTPHAALPTILNSNNSNDGGYLPKRILRGEMKFDYDDIADSNDDVGTQ